MARGKPYTPEEDLIILAHESTADIVRDLKANGFERGADSIRTRKSDLRKRKADPAGLYNERHEIMQELAFMEKRKEKLATRLAQITVQLVADVLEVSSDELPADVLAAIQEVAERGKDGNESH